ncbi:hypothetical protein D029_4042B, partial [Vibrio parahaemolyticus 970107]
GSISNTLILSLLRAATKCAGSRQNPAPCSTA